MARRSDHTRAELEAMIIAEGHRQMAQHGFARFSAREVAKRIGYSIGTLYNVFGSHDALILAINAQTVVLWVEAIEARLETAGEFRIDALVTAYFDFAREHRNVWSAIYDHRLPLGTPVPDWYIAIVGRLTGVMRREVQAALPQVDEREVAALGRSLLASVHGHCVFAMDGTFSQLGEAAPLDAALARVHEAIAVASTLD